MSCDMLEKAGAELRKLRKKTGLSIFKVAKKVHISGNYLSLLERGANAPSNTVLFNLSEFYNVPPEQLFKLYGKVVPPTPEQLIKMPSLKKIITEISIDPRLSDEEKEIFANRIYEIASNLNVGVEK